MSEKVIVRPEDIVRVKDCETVPSVFKGYIGIVKLVSDIVLVEFMKINEMMITHRFKPDELIRIGKLEGDADE